MREILIDISTYTGIAFENVLMGFIFIMIVSAVSFMFWLQSKHLKKEYNETTAEANSKGKITSYTKGNYAADVKQFVKLYKTAVTIPEQHALEEVCKRIIQNVDKIEMIGRSSFNGRMWAGIDDTFKACKSTLAYLGKGKNSLDILRTSVYFTVKYYDEEKKDTVLGVTRFIRNANQVKFHQEITKQRMPKQMKKRISEKGNHRTQYLIGLGRWQPIQSAISYSQGL